MNADRAGPLKMLADCPGSFAWVYEHQIGTKSTGRNPVIHFGMQYVSKVLRAMAINVYCLLGTSRKRTNKSLCHCHCLLGTYDYRAIFVGNPIPETIMRHRAPGPSNLCTDWGEQPRTHRLLANSVEKVTQVLPCVRPVACCGAGVCLRMK
ncbi:uncharacterized protein LOC133925933 [Phragmites australis]|uniref:uncharacterized protein LOC133925933 n=1 Tax=Phragmites australis TaxID=29695 RepID=UPI002D77EAF2|nr:uncharacterized protein LOC133925933 [Phragmites australis]